MLLVNLLHFLIEYPGYLLSIIDVENMIKYGGILIIILSVYAQTGLFFCFFVPSGAFLFTGGMFIATGQLQYNLFFICTFLVAACVAGTLTGYWFGLKTGPLLYKRKDSRFFRQVHLRTAEAFYNKYGHIALTLGILFPVIRTFAPIIAGITRTKFSHFILLVFAGSFVWVVSFVMAGYLIGSLPALKEYLPYVMPAIICAATIPTVINIMKGYKKFSKQNNTA